MSSKKDEYIKMYQTLHARGNMFPGHSVVAHASNVASLIKETSSKTLLDYGCGKGKQYSQLKVHEQWGGILPDLYDPGVGKYSKLPNKTWDGVICTDVMEHVPESAVEEVLTEIIKSSKKFVFFNISTRLASAKLPNGENAHCTVKDHDWWENIVSKVKTQLGSTSIILLSSKKEKTSPCIYTEL